MAFVKIADFGQQKSPCQTVCVFCYKLRKSSKSSESENNGSVQLFFKLLERFVEEDLTKSKFGQFSDHEKILVGCCDDCECIINSFCDLFHQVKCLELQLQWKLETLVKIMKLANRVPSRLQYVKRMLHENRNLYVDEGHDKAVKKGEEDDVERKLKEFKSFRSRMMRKCSRMLSHSQPRVSLRKIVDEDVDPLTSKTEVNQNLEAGVQRFLGWILSFTAVAVLVASISAPKEHDNLTKEALQIDAICEVDYANDGFSEEVDENPHVGDSDRDIASELGFTSEDIVELENAPKSEEVSHPEIDEVPEAPVITEGDSSSIINEEPPINLIDDILSQDENCQKFCNDGDHTRKSSYTQIKVKEEPNYSTSDSDSSSSSDSEHSIEDIEPETRQNRKRERPRNSSDLKCSLDGCDVPFRNQKKYKEHQNFHAPGEYKCNFCDVVEDTVVQLGVHELTNHSRNAGHCSISKAQVISCPRCPLEAAKMWVYKVHFAKVHIPGFAKFSWFGRRERRPENRVSCEMCQLRIRRGLEGRSKVSHFERWHDLTGVESKNIVKCDMDGCSAFFSGKNGSVHLAKTKLTEHKKVAHEYTLPSKVKEDNDSDEFSEENLGSSEADQLKRLFCKICNLKTHPGLVRKRRKSHFKRWHDTTQVDIKDIIRCDLDNCSAIFVKRKTGDKFLINKRLKAHKMEAHGFKEEELSNKQEIQKLGCSEAHCGLQFRTQKDLDTHRKLHGRFPCKFCDVVKDNAPDLALHETEHAVRNTTGANAGAKIYSCSRCPVDKISKVFFISHFVESHLDLSSKTETCPICQLQSTANTKDNLFLRQHMKIYHKTDGLHPSKIFKCDQCPGYFIKREQLVQHTLTIHYQNKCPVCGKTKFRDLVNMRLHIVTKHPEFTSLRNLLLICDVGNCRATFVRESDLERHKKEGKCAIDYDKVFECAKCNREFKGQLSLKIHMKNAHKEPRHVCEECGKTFRQKWGLDQHILYHKGPNSWAFQCSLCGKKFPRKHALQAHQTSHTKEKPWVCEACGQTYSKRQDWRNHLMSKHKEKYDEMGLEGKWKSVNERKLVSRKGIRRGHYVLSQDH